MTTLPNEIAREDGFRDSADAIRGLREYYENNLTEKSQLAYFRFEMLHHNGDPVLKLTQCE